MERLNLWSSRNLLPFLFFTYSYVLLMGHNKLPQSIHIPSNISCFLLESIRWDGPFKINFGHALEMGEKIFAQFSGWNKTRATNFHLSPPNHSPSNPNLLSSFIDFYCSSTMDSWYAEAYTNFLLNYNYCYGCGRWESRPESNWKFASRKQGHNGLRSVYLAFLEYITRFRVVRSIY